MDTSFESNVASRSQVGVQDFILLEDYRSEPAFLENLRKRYNESLIYTYIGSVLVSVNPYKDVGIFTTQYMKNYYRANLYEQPPHIYAIIDNAYRFMLNEGQDQCILISGESGAGKTEASKKILEYIAEVSAHTRGKDIRDMLLNSNPILEAFGNARTTRNDNSSRFGKYMDVEFDHMGAPVGGKILNYLLEKSRVVHQLSGERNFHIFYQILSGTSDEKLKSLRLQRNPQNYYYTKQGDADVIKGKSDSSDYSELMKAFQILKFSDKDVESVISVVAAIIHLGEINFKRDDEEEDKIIITKQDSLVNVADLIQCTEIKLTQALTHRTVDVRNDKTLTPLTIDQAYYARDALAKAIYSRLFTWLVENVNASIVRKDTDSKSVLGLLDIYGFEVFEVNSFEQFCINYCNEKLHQLFINLILKSEQEEYENEGIEWETVDFFNNKEICSLLDERHHGIYAVLDEQCLRPGNVTDSDFLDALKDKHGDHKYFISHSQKISKANSKLLKTLKQQNFRIKHYAGDVDYDVKGFVDKNNDLLYRNLKETIMESPNPVLRNAYKESEINSLKRPATAGTHFKTSVEELLSILCSKLPSYIRCIKPNNDKRPNKFNTQVVSHQVKYLALLENLRVRRAGFAYRRQFEFFLTRYKCLCPQTWPVWKGEDKDGVEVLCKHLYPTEEYKLGKTKVFLRNPKMLFDAEDKFQVKKNYIATVIQSKYRMYTKRKEYLRIIAAVNIIANNWRRVAAIRLRERRKRAVQAIKKFIKGFITRNGPLSDDNKQFIQYARISFLETAARNLPKTVLDKSWIKAPTALVEASELLRDMHMQYMVRKYVKNITPQRKDQLNLKLKASEFFKGKKLNYPESVSCPFVPSRLTPEQSNVKQTGFDKTCNEKTVAAYLLDDKNGKVKQNIPFVGIKDITVTNKVDGLVLLTLPVIDKKDKGDLILSSEHVIEFVMMLARAAQKFDVLTISDSASLSHTMKNDKRGEIQLKEGSTLTIGKSKDGKMEVLQEHILRNYNLILVVIGCSTLGLAIAHLQNYKRL
ncbi:Unconventional myosin-Ic [Trichoplax sp. H2]|nr:Unconventional myosin-Ic [Trichoplax sp. H2]|eukprot:RDD43026.1 Unconventional myosin-Ic [Trichoplax sp. H2]